MKAILKKAFFLITLGSHLFIEGQDLTDVQTGWRQTLDALSAGKKQKAKDLFADFNQKARGYVRTNGRTWQIEYLIGSLNCQFSESRTMGAKLLADILQNNRGLTSAGEREIARQLTACLAPGPAAPISDVQPHLPRDIASAHFQLPGVHGDMKGGYNLSVQNESATVSPLSPVDLMARRVPLSEPKRALDAALARLPLGASGGIVKEFAITDVSGDASRAIDIGKCLEGYTPFLKSQFELKPPTYMVTVYSANSTGQVYEYARSLHGIQLPQES